MSSTSEAALSPDTDGVSVPPPARGRARVRLAALLVLGLGCLASAWLLRGSAAYALLGGGPQTLGNLATAKLEVTGARGSWVQGFGEVERDAISFRRRGEPGSFVLGRLVHRRDLWVLLPVPTGALEYLPPRVLEGRLVSRQAMGLRFLPVAQLMQQRGSGASDHLLVVGGRPADYETDLWLLLLLATLGLAATGRFFVLALPVRQASKS